MRPICAVMQKYISAHCYIRAEESASYSIDTSHGVLDWGNCLDSETDDSMYIDEKTNDEFVTDEDFVEHVYQQIQLGV